MKRSQFKELIRLAYCSGWITCFHRYQLKASQPFDDFYEQQLGDYLQQVLDTVDQDHEV